MNPNTFSAVAFLSGTSMDSAGRYVAEYRAFTPEQWEDCHNHIQWAFPSSIPSQFNPDAPVINWSEFKRITAFGSDKMYLDSYAVYDNLRDLILMYLESIGIVTVDGEPSISTAHVDRIAWLMNPYDHNLRRITRLMMLWYHLGQFYREDDISSSEYIDNAMLLIFNLFRLNKSFSEETNTFWIQALYHGKSPN